MTERKCSGSYVLVRLAVITKYRRLGGLNNRNLFSQSGGWKSEIRVPVWSGSGE